MSAEPVFDPDRVVAALNAAGVEYVIVGGLAVGAHGVVRATRDVDVVAAPDRRNMDRLAECLQTLGGEHPIEGPLTGAALARPASFKVQTKHGEVQVLNRMDGIPGFAELRRDQIYVEIASDAVAPVCSLAHLRAMKRAADRPRDRVDLAELDELHGPAQGPRGEVSDLLAEIEAGLGRDFRSKPVAIAWAMKDLAFTEEVLERLWLKTFPGPTVTRIEGAGHYLQEDAHERIVPALLEHLGRD